MPSSPGLWLNGFTVMCLLWLVNWSLQTCNKQCLLLNVQCMFTKQVSKKYTASPSLNILIYSFVVLWCCICMIIKYYLMNNSVPVQMMLFCCYISLLALEFCAFFFCLFHGFYNERKYCHLVLTCPIFVSCVAPQGSVVFVKALTTMRLCMYCEKLKKHHTICIK